MKRERIKKTDDEIKAMKKERNKLKKQTKDLEVIIKLRNKTDDFNARIKRDNPKKNKKVRRKALNSEKK